MSKLFHVKHREAMEGSGRLGGYEHIAARRGREEAAFGRAGDKLLHLVKYGNKNLSTTYQHVWISRLKRS